MVLVPPLQPPPPPPSAETRKRIPARCGLFGEARPAALITVWLLLPLRTAGCHGNQQKRTGRRFLAARLHLNQRWNHQTAFWISQRAAAAKTQSRFFVFFFFFPGLESD